MIHSSYDFDGTFVNGKLNGSGILTISKDIPPQQRCIIVKSSVFDLPSPDKIEGEFQVRPLIWQYQLWSFQAGGTKLGRFLPKNQDTQRKFLNFENWGNGEVSKSAKI